MGLANTIIRPSTESDLTSIGRHYGPLDTLGDPFCDVSKIQAVRLDWLVVAEVGGEYAGFLYWHLGKNPFFDPKVAMFAHMREVQVLAKFQRRGIGRKLMTYALDKLGGLGVSDVFLSTAETNDIAKHLYEAIGFEEFRKQIHYRLRMKP